MRKVIVAKSGKVIFDGSSDDCMHATSGNSSEEWYPVAEKGHYMGAFLINEGEFLVLKVHVIYDGCWSFAVSMPEEGITETLEDIKTSVHVEHEYCAGLTVEGLKYGMTVTLENDNDDGDDE